MPQKNDGKILYGTVQKILMGVEAFRGGTPILPFIPGDEGGGHTQVLLFFQGGEQDFAKY